MALCDDGFSCGHCRDDKVHDYDYVVADEAKVVACCEFWLEVPGFDTKRHNCSDL